MNKQKQNKVKVERPQLYIKSGRRYKPYTDPRREWYLKGEGTYQCEFGTIFITLCGDAFVVELFKIESPDKKIALRFDNVAELENICNEMLRLANELLHL